MRSDTSSPSRRRGARAGLVGGLAAVLAGCAAPRVGAPLTRTLSGNRPHERGEFWYQLARRPLASNDEAFHALLIYRDGADPATTYAGRVRAMVAAQMLPADFAGQADEAIDRGTLAVAIDRLVDVRGGVTMSLFGPSPRYALRAAVDAGLFPRSSTNQSLTGGELVGIMQKAEEYQLGNPDEGPATLLPSQIHPAAPAPVASTTAPLAAEAQPLLSPVTSPPPLVYLDDIVGSATATAKATTAPAREAHLTARVIGIEGDMAELRASPRDPWRPAVKGIEIHEGTEIRTGPKTAIQFQIPTDQTFCLDSDGLVTVRQATLNGRNAKTRVVLERGRYREVLSHNDRVPVPARIDPGDEGAVPIEMDGVAHDTVIQSPSSALSLRGTMVSLFEQQSFGPVAVSLTGRATFTNVAGMRVAFGAVNRHQHVVIIGSQTSAAQQAADRAGSLASSGNGARQAFETREEAIVAQRGGFRRGDVVVGNLHLADFGTRANGAPNLPGALDFALQWNGGPAQSLNDLNLAVFSPLHTAADPDFVANPPFTVSLTPNSPTSIATRRTNYPRTSRTGGQISANSVGPDGLELAFWPKNFPTGTYRVRVYDLADVVPSPALTVNPVNYTLSVFRNGDLVGTFAGTLGELQTSPTINVPITDAVGTATARRPSQPTPVRASANAPGRRRAKA